MLLDRSGSVQIVLGGSVMTVPYRRAVGLIATGRATWYEAPSEPAKAPRKPKQVTLVPEEGPEIVQPATGTIVSTPTTGVEGDLTGNEPSPIDP